MGDMEDLELQLKIKVQGQEALDKAAQSTSKLGDASKKESANVDLLGDAAVKSFEKTAKAA